MFFTKEDYEKIAYYLKNNAIKDSLFENVSLPLSGDETIALVLRGQNRNIKISTLIEILGGKVTDISAPYVKQKGNLVTIEAVNADVIYYAIENENFTNTEEYMVRLYLYTGPFTINANATIRTFCTWKGLISTVNTTDVIYTKGKKPNPILITGVSKPYSNEAITLIQRDYNGYEGDGYYSIDTELTIHNYTEKGKTYPPSAINTGSYTVYFYIPENDDYLATAGSVTSTILKIQTPASCKGQTLTVQEDGNGEKQPQLLIQFYNGSAYYNAQPTIYYSVDKEMTSDNYLSVGTNTSPTAKDAGTYNIWYLIKHNDTDNYLDKLEKVKTVIEKLKIFISYDRSALNPMVNLEVIISPTDTSSWPGTKSQEWADRLTFDLKYDENTTVTRIIELNGKWEGRYKAKFLTSGTHTINLTVTDTKEVYNCIVSPYTWSFNVAELKDNPVRITRNTPTWNKNLLTILLIYRNNYDGNIYYSSESLLTKDNYQLEGTPLLEDKIQCINAGKYTYYFYCPATSLYKELSTEGIISLINKATPELSITKTGVNLTTNDTEIITVTSTNPWLYSISNSNVVSCKKEGTTLRIDALTPGTAIITITSEETENYNKATKQISVTVKAPTPYYYYGTLTDDLVEKVLLNESDPYTAISKAEMDKLLSSYGVTTITKATLVNSNKVPVDNVQGDIVIVVAPSNYKITLYDTDNNIIEFVTATKEDYTTYVKKRGSGISMIVNNN